MLLSNRKKSIGNPALVENLNRTGVQPTSPRSHEILVRAPLNDGNINAG
jgi:hypothetical protein